MSADPTSLDHLHDIIVPAPVPWWPPAPGWYWVMGFASVALFVALVRGFIRWQHNRYRREALAELAGIESNLGNRNQRAAVLLSLSELVKRTALTAFPREDVASLTGPEWFAFLDRTAKEATFGDGLGEMLERVIYDPSAASAINESTLEKFVAAIRRWIKSHQPIGPQELNRR